MSVARIWAAALLCGVTGCAVGPSYRTPAPDAPARYVGAVRGSAAGPAAADPAAPSPDLATWWRALGDTELDSLVERAIKANLDLDVALTRLQRARTYEAGVLGRALPQVDATAAAARGTGSDLTRARAEQGLRSADNSSGLAHINTVAGFDAVWELDVFGKYRREIEAAHYDTQAAAAARNGVLTSVVADVVRTYVDLRGFQIQAGILGRASEVLRESLRIVDIRYQRGITNELDVALAKRELATVEAQIAPVEAQQNAAKYALAELLGEYPDTLIVELASPGLIPAMPGPVQPGVPLELLRRRPDIQQAERELAGATARVGVATANLFPQFVLVGAIGSQSQGLGTSPGVSKHIWSFGPGAVWPLLDFGALDAQVDVAGLEVHAQLDIYRRTILSAVQEVDTSLAAYSAQQERLHNLGDALLSGQRAVDLATERYSRGLTDFLNVVDAQRQFYDLEQQYAAAQATEAEQFVRLYKSLGGGWENYQNVPAIRQPQPAIIAAFRRLLSRSTP
jgi:NodT family efflux transporter outer membrane factor (OMF) lipoprotein